MRLWIACFAGSLAVLAALAPVAGVIANAGTAADPRLLLGLLGCAAAVALLVAFVAGAWIVRGVAGSLHRIDRALEEGRLGDRTPGISEWGELGSVAHRVRALLEAQRELARSRAALAQTQEELERAREAVERWIATERWEPKSPPSGLSALGQTLDRCFTRHVEVADQSLGAALLVRDDLSHVAEEARDAAGLAEHGYVEATALLTTLGEIARLTSEIQPAATTSAEPLDVGAEWRARTASALEELVEVSTASVAELGAGLAKVQEIGAQVQLLSNRATLIALDAIVGAGRSESRPTGVPVLELKQLAAEVRGANDRVAQLTADVEHAASEVNDRMRAVRERVLERIEEPFQVPPPPTPSAELVRLAARMREMVQDARRKGDRLSNSNERASAATQRVARRLEDQLRDLEGLIVRLTPTGVAVPGESPGDAQRGSRRFRVLEGQTPEEPPASRPDDREEHS